MKMRAGVSVPIACATLALLTLSGCRPAALPEQGSYPEQLYVQQCGQKCHQPYNPHSLTSAMWQVEMRTMDDKIVHAGLPPLTPEQRQTIMDYLERNAGHQ